MKKSSAKKSDDVELLAEYDAEFFRTMKPNRFASRNKLGRLHASSARPAKRAKKRGT